MEILSVIALLILGIGCIAFVAYLAIQVSSLCEEIMIKDKRITELENDKRYSSAVFDMEPGVIYEESSTMTEEQLKAFEGVSDRLKNRRPGILAQTTLEPEPAEPVIIFDESDDKKSIVIIKQSNDMAIIDVMVIMENSEGRTLEDTLKKSDMFCDTEDDKKEFKKACKSGWSRITPEPEKHVEPEQLVATNIQCPNCQEIIEFVYNLNEYGKYAEKPNVLCTEMRNNVSES